MKLCAFATNDTVIQRTENGSNENQHKLAECVRSIAFFQMSTHKFVWRNKLFLEFFTIKLQSNTHTQFFFFHLSTCD